MSRFILGSQFWNLQIIGVPFSFIPSLGGRISMVSNFWWTEPNLGSWKYKYNRKDPTNPSKGMLLLILLDQASLSYISKKP